MKTICKYCGIELIGDGCINMCWLLAGDPNPYAATPANPTNATKGEVDR